MKISFYFEKKNGMKLKKLQIMFILYENNRNTNNFFNLLFLLVFYYNRCFYMILTDYLYSLSC